MKFFHNIVIVRHLYRKINLNMRLILLNEIDPAHIFFKE